MALPKKSDEYVYHKLNELVPGQSRINVYGVLLEIDKEILPGPKNKFCGRIRIVDESCNNGSSFLIHLFLESVEKFPALEKDTIIRLHRVKVESFNGVTDGRIFSSKDLVVFPRSAAVKPEFSTAASTIQFTGNDKARLAELRKWITSRGESSKNHTMAQNSPVAGNDAVQQGQVSVAAGSPRKANPSDPSEQKDPNEKISSSNRKKKQASPKKTEPESDILSHRSPARQLESNELTQNVTRLRKEKRLLAVNEGVSNEKRLKISEEPSYIDAEATAEEEPWSLRLFVRNPASYVLKNKLPNPAYQKPELGERNEKMSNTTSANPVKISSLVPSVKSTEWLAKPLAEDSPPSKYASTSNGRKNEKENSSTSTAVKPLYIVLERCSPLQTQHHPNSHILAKKMTSSKDAGKESCVVGHVLPSTSSTEAIAGSFSENATDTASKTSAKESVTVSARVPVLPSNEPSASNGALVDKSGGCPGLVCANGGCALDVDSISGPVLAEDSESDLLHSTDETLFQDDSTTQERLADYIFLKPAFQYLLDKSLGAAVRIDLKALGNFSWPTHRVSVQFVEIKPSLKCLKSYGPKNLVSGRCKQCWQYFPYSKLNWKDSKPGCKRPLCPSCAVDGIERFVTLDYRLKAIVKDLVGTSLKLTVSKKDAQEFLGIAVLDYQLNPAMRAETLKKLETVVSSKQYYDITVRTVFTQVDAQHHIYQTQLSKLVG